MSDIRALIFDMDGVIVDSNPVHCLAWGDYNRSQGVETTEAMQQRIYGRRNDEIVRDFLGAHLAETRVLDHGAAKERLYRQIMKPQLEERLVPGVRAFLLRHCDLRLAVATNAEASNVDMVLGETGLRRFFSAVIDGSEVANPKPHPEIFLKAADMLGVPPEACVVFEDSYAGVQASLAAGMRVAGLSTTHAELPGVSLVVRDFTDPALGNWLAACRVG